VVVVVDDVAEMVALLGVESGESAWVGDRVGEWV
jgi:hypothetical protein